MSNREHKFLVVGLHSSGKTTFAAALWHLVDSRELKTVLAKGRHKGDYTYLEKIAGLWAEGYQQERTTDVHHVEIPLIHTQSSSEISLRFNDLAGESYEKIFATRETTEELIQQVNESDGILLFVSANRKADDVTIIDFFRMTGTSVGESDKDEPDPPWNPASTPHQSQLVDLLTSFQLRPFDSRKRRVAVVISAWDQAAVARPVDWLAQKMPLLNQYLSARENGYEALIYGVSAQGGKLGKKGEPATEDRERLLDIPTASHRIRVINEYQADHDLTRAICWLGGFTPEVN